MTTAARESLRSPTPGPSAHVIECPFDGALMFGITEGKWTAGGDAYAEVIYRHDGCPAVDPTARGARPALLTNPPTRRRRRLFSRSS